MISMTLGPCPPPLEIQSGHLQQLQEQFDIDHVQEEAETAIQEKAFELGKKAEKGHWTHENRWERPRSGDLWDHEPRKAPRKPYEHGHIWRIISHSQTSPTHW